MQAGGRRWRALKLLVKQKRLAKDAAIPCIIKTTGIIEDDSLAENTEREALHPLDQFRAFATLRDKGQSEEDIAAAFAVTPAVVRQRLKLASASPKLLDAYAEDRIALDQLMAFCVTDDNARQEQVFEAIQQRQISDGPHNIRRLLTETCVEATDPRARFVGLEAYVAAGGTIMRDLFEPDDGGWLQDPDLLMRLVSEKLAAARQRILAHGWKWAEAALDLPYNLQFSLRRLQPTGETLTDEEEKHYLALSEEHDGLIEGLEDDHDIPAEVRARLDSIEAELAELDNRPPKFSPEDIARGGVLVSVDHNGQLNVEYGFLRPEDQPRPDGETEHSGDAGDTEAPADADGEFDPGEADEADAEPAGKGLPDKLLQDLTAYRTVALREAVARNFDTAFLALLHAMCLEHFYHYAPHSCLQIKATSHFPGGAAGLGDMAAAKAIEERHDQWVLTPLRSACALGCPCAPQSPERAGPVVQPLRQPHHQCRARAASAAPRGAAACRSFGRRGVARHGVGWLVHDGGQLSEPHHQGPNPRGRARGQGRKHRAAHRPFEEGRHGQGGRAPARGHRLAAGGSAHAAP